MPPAQIIIREMRIEDYDELIAFWKSIKGMGLSSADEKWPIQAYLERNPGLSLVARDSHSLVGAVLGGHDGRRGYLHHLAVAPSHRSQGLGRDLVDECLERLRAEGIEKCHLFVFADNEQGIGFWQAVDWSLRDDLEIMSLDL